MKSSKSFKSVIQNPNTSSPNVKSTPSNSSEILKIRKIRDSEYLISGNITLKSFWEKTRSIASLRGGCYIICLYQIAFSFVENKSYLMHSYPLSVPIFFRIIPLDDLLKSLIIPSGRLSTTFISIT